MKKYYIIVFIFATFLTWEYSTLNFEQDYSFFYYLKMQNIFFFKTLNLSTSSGKPLGYLYGWIGFIIMLFTFPYIFRKRLSSMKKMGKLRNWLDFHIFCGILGPIFVIFHSDFKIGGLVAISFWSMIIAAGSGIIGKYIYTQLAVGNSELKRNAKLWSNKLYKYQKESPHEVSDETIEVLKKNALKFAGLPENQKIDGVLEFFFSLIQTIAGDFRMTIGYPDSIDALPSKSRFVLSQYATTMRRLIYFRPFQKMMGYWHTFHLPFSIFMWVTAIIHIVVTLIFRVSAFAN